MKKIALILLMVFLPSIYRRRYANAPIYFKHYFFQKILGFNRVAYWPMDFRSTVRGAQYIYVGVGSAPGYCGGCYIVANENAPILIGDYTIMSANVVLPAYDHDIYNYRNGTAGGIEIGSFCWIGANVTILPNVKLGNHVIVGANSVVTKSFEDGYCVIAGNPATVIKTLDPTKCMEIIDEHEFHGYIPKEQFGEFRNKRLKI